MRKLITISEGLNDMIKSVSRKEGINQSHLIETALTIYLVMFKGAPLQAKKLSEMIVPGQTDIMDFLKTEKQPK